MIIFFMLPFLSLLSFLWAFCVEVTTQSSCPFWNGAESHLSSYPLSRTDERMKRGRKNVIKGGENHIKGWSRLWLFLVRERSTGDLTMIITIIMRKKVKRGEEKGRHYHDFMWELHDIIKKERKRSKAWMKKWCKRRQYSASKENAFYVPPKKESWKKRGEMWRCWFFKKNVERRGMNGNPVPPFVELRRGVLIGCELLNFRI